MLLLKFCSRNKIEINETQSDRNAAHSYRMNLDIVSVHLVFKVYVEKLLCLNSNLFIEYIGLFANFS